MIHVFMFFYRTMVTVRASMIKDMVEKHTEKIPVMLTRQPQGNYLLSFLSLEIAL